MHLWKHSSFDVGPSLELRIDHQVLKSHRVDLVALLDITVFVPRNHVVKYGIHVFTQEVLIVGLQIEGCVGVLGLTLSDFKLSLVGLPLIAMIAPRHL